jgi:O-antigen ligase
MVVSFFMLILTVYFLKDKKIENTIFNILRFIVLIQSVICIIQYEKGFLMYGTFYHDANLTMYIMFFLVFAIWKYAFNQYRSLSTVLVIILALFPFVFAQQRTAWIAMLLASIPFLLKNKKILLLYFGIAFPIFVFAKDEITERILLLLNFGGNGTYDTANSAGWRLNVWNQMFRAANEQPLFGKGLGSSNGFVESIYSGVAFLPHNEFLRIYYETGIVGIILFLAFLLSPLFIFRVYFRKIENKSYILLFISLTAAYFACMAPDNIAALADVSTLYFTIIGIIIASLISSRCS